MGLNEAQKDAVLHKDGPCLVLAGPGSGKTLTIVNRVKYLIEGYKVRPSGHFMGFIMESFDGLTGSDRRICSRIMKNIRSSGR